MAGCSLFETARWPGERLRMDEWKLDVPTIG